jgi:pSer/pThr/pTyr-binding forkhead associated (FHA) protein
MATPDKVSAIFETTRREPALTRFCHRRPPMHWVGLLSPLSGLTKCSIRIDRAELSLGRVGCDIFFQDESVSRHHARIWREGDTYLLEDLGSSNGTHVDGIPILSCVLRDGDTVQVGQSLFLFERLLEQVGPASRSAP